MMLMTPTPTPMMAATYPRVVANHRSGSTTTTARVRSTVTRRGAVVKTRASVDPKTEYASLGQVCAGTFWVW